MGVEDVGCEGVDDGGVGVEDVECGRWRRGCGVWMMEV